MTKHGKRKGKFYSMTLAVCDRCGCLLPERVLVVDDYGIACASLIRCDQRRRERLAAESAQRDVAVEELR